MGADAQNQLSAANAKASRDALRTDLVALGRQESQAQQAAAQTVLQADRQSREAEGLARVSAGESGVAGSSVDVLLSGMERDRLEHNTGVARGLKNSVAQAELERRSAWARFNGRVDAVLPSDPAALAIGIGGDVAGLGASYFSKLPSIKKD